MKRHRVCDHFALLMSGVPLIEEVWPRADAKQSHLEVSFFSVPAMRGSSAHTCSVFGLLVTLSVCQIKAELGIFEEICLPAVCALT